MCRHKNEGDGRRSGIENPLKKRWIIPLFYDVTWLIFETLCPVTIISKPTFMIFRDTQKL